MQHFCTYSCTFVGLTKNGNLLRLVFETENVAGTETGSDGNQQQRRGQTETRRSGITHPVTTYKQRRDGITHPGTTYKQRSDGITHPVTTYKQRRDGITHPVTTYKQRRDGITHPVTTQTET